MKNLRYIIVMSVFTAIFFGATGFKKNRDGNGAITDLIVHEWGTFTSVQGSNGKVLAGLHHGDEFLPHFIHCPLGNPIGYSACVTNLMPGLNSPLATTQRLETPVIYFYSPVERDVTVKVDFPGGVFSEWYPNESSYSPIAGQVQNLANGTATWKVHIHMDELEVPSVGISSIWQPSRDVAANYISTPEGENEKFIFYRGIGRFELPIRVTSMPTFEIDGVTYTTIYNKSAENIPGAVLLNFKNGKGFVKALGDLAPNSSLKMEENFPTTLETAEYLAAARGALLVELERSGLYKDEALAMVNTWEKSYFLTPGLRVLYVLPKKWTEELLPMTLDPQPKELVRTLVGRVEIITHSEEAALLARLETAAAANEDMYNVIYEISNDSSIGSGGDRFLEPRLWRTHELLAGYPQAQAYVQKMAEYIAVEFE